MTTTAKKRTYVALLRGINVGGGKKVPMAQLRALMEGLGHTRVRTYLQSGNVVFDSEGADTGALAKAMEEAIRSHFGFPVACLVVDGPRLRTVVEGCPFPAEELEGKQLHAVFLSAPASAKRYATIDPQAFLPEEFRLGDHVVYLYTPNGLGRSKLAEELVRPARTKGLDVTTRNWNTVSKLMELVAE
ncbi:DUF1697 domain-containing protein [Streptomyces sp. NPDC006879]|uniref:DUF1697 domain-containing protein n=1 Tax=Streptomyces sp. NPDC006879 TaxID=3364767 RepID=UPI0036C5590E